MGFYSYDVLWKLPAGGGFLYLRPTPTFQPPPPPRVVHSFPGFNKPGDMYTGPSSHVIDFCFCALRLLVSQKERRSQGRAQCNPERAQRNPPPTFPETFLNFLQLLGIPPRAEILGPSLGFLTGTYLLDLQGPGRMQTRLLFHS